MELPQQNENLVQKESMLAPLQKVTPLSKYLAVAVFIALPFIGGLVGYALAPDEIKEIESVVLVEKKSASLEDITSRNNVQESVASENNIPEQIVSLPIIAEIPSDWESYTDSELGFSIKHPSGIYPSKGSLSETQTGLSFIPDAVMLFIDKDKTREEIYKMESETFANFEKIEYACVIAGFEARCIDVIDHVDGLTHISIFEVNDQIYTFFVIDKFIEKGNLFTTTIEFLKD